MTQQIPNVLTIAGIDPSGGAGVLADVKVMSALGTFATAVVAALTAQNTCAVTGVMPVPADFVSLQMETLFSDVRIDAVKIGMVSQSDVIRAIARSIRAHQPRWVVLDPVMVAKSGDKLLEDEAIETFKAELLPLATVVTPNLPEASVLIGKTITDRSQMQQAAKDLLKLCGPQCAVYLKGGHLTDGPADDLFYDGRQFLTLSSARVATKNTHGTGCSLSSAIAAYLAKTNHLEQSIRQAKDYIAQAIAAADSLSVGKGHGPIHHFVRLW